MRRQSRWWSMWTPTGRSRCWWTGPGARECRAGGGLCGRLQVGAGASGQGQEAAGAREGRAGGGVCGRLQVGAGLVDRARRQQEQEKAEQVVEYVDAYR